MVCIQEVSTKSGTKDAAVNTDPTSPPPTTTTATATTAVTATTTATAVTVDPPIFPAEMQPDSKC